MVDADSQAAQGPALGGNTPQLDSSAIKGSLAGSSGMSNRTCELGEMHTNFAPGGGSKPRVLKVRSAVISP